MKIEYFIVYGGDDHGVSLALEEGAVVHKHKVTADTFTVVSLKDRIAAHNRDAKRARNGTPRFTDPEKYLLWLHQSGETVHYVKAGPASGDPAP